MESLFLSLIFVIISQPDPLSHIISLALSCVTVLGVEGELRTQAHADPLRVTPEQYQVGRASEKGSPPSPSCLSPGRHERECRANLHPTPRLCQVTCPPDRSVSEA